MRAAFACELGEIILVDPTRHRLEATRKHEVAIVHAADYSKFIEIEESAAPFVYAHIMGTRQGEPFGYSEAELDGWASKARDWARNDRQVFFYFISGAKLHNPAAATGIDRKNLTDGHRSGRVGTPHWPGTFRARSQNGLGIRVRMESGNPR